MTSHRTAEYLAILQENFKDDLKIEATRTDTEWDSVFYDFQIYLHSKVVISLKNNKERLQQFLMDGAGAVLDNQWVFCDEDFDELVKNYFYFLFEKGYLNNLGGDKK